MHCHILVPFQGKLEVEIELLTEEEACQRPAGKGREEPNMHPSLEEPHRPPTSFLWFTSPIKSFRYIIWKNYKFHIIGAVVIILAVLSLVIFIYTAPVSIMMYIHVCVRIYACTHVQHMHNIMYICLLRCAILLIKSYLSTSYSLQHSLFLFPFFCSLSFVPLMHSVIHSPPLCPLIFSLFPQSQFMNWITNRILPG